MKKNQKLKRRWYRISVAAIVMTVLNFTISIIEAFTALWYMPGTQGFDESGKAFAMFFLSGMICAIWMWFSIETHSKICQKIQKTQNLKSTHYRSQMNDLNEDFRACAESAENRRFSNLCSFFLEEQ